MDIQDSSINKKLHLQTPTVFSPPLSKLSGFSVYLKLENLQVPGSFKIRGVGNLCQKAKQNGCKRIVCASGGNAGLAAAYSAQQLGIPATIVLPKSTPQFVADKLISNFSVEVLYHGDMWDESNEYALKLASEPGCVYIHPFDHPDVWDGHSTLIKEAALQLDSQPDLVVTCCGGGGLMNGVLQGMWKEGWTDVPLLVMETRGAESLNAAIKAGKLVTLPGITSVAKSLGSCTVAKTSLEYCSKHKVVSSVVDDKDAISACLRFADDHRMLVEPACGATLSAVYSEVIQKLQKAGELGPVKNVLLIVCGGNAVSLSQLQTWKEQFNI